jgi:transposase
LGWGHNGVKTYIPEPERRYEWSWLDRPEAQQQAVTNNRRRTKREYGKQLQRRRSEVVERCFAHVCETGGGRRSWLRGIDEVRKRHLMAATAHNLGLVLRTLLGTGKVRQFGSLCAGIFARFCGVICAYTRMGSSYKQPRVKLHKQPINYALVA